MIKSTKKPCECYFNGLPASQRFVFVLRLMGGMNEEQISDVIGLKESIIHSIIEVESDNLAKIYFTAKNNVEHCIPPTKELISSSIKEELLKISVPDVLDKKVEAYIDSVATPIEEAEKKKYQKRIFITITAIICIVVLILVLSKKAALSEICFISWILSIPITSILSYSKASIWERAYNSLMRFGMILVRKSSAISFQ